MSVYQKIIFLISQPKHILWVLKRISLGSFEHPKYMFKLMGKKITNFTLKMFAYSPMVWFPGVCVSYKFV